MTEIDKKSLTERDICTKFITPAIAQANWNVMTQVREEVTLTDGRVIVRGKLTARGKKKRADYRSVMGQGRVEGEYYLSPLSMKSGHTHFCVSSFRKP